MNHTGRLLAAAVSLAAVASLAVTACSAPAAPAHRTEEQAAVLNWLAKTNAMWTQNNFAALDEITTAEMRTIYLAEQRGASLPSNASRQPFQLTGLSITIPCQAGRRRLRRLRRHRCLRPRPGHAAHGYGVRAGRRPVEAGRRGQPPGPRLARAVHERRAA